MEQRDRRLEEDEKPDDEVSEDGDDSVVGFVFALMLVGVSARTLEHLRFESAPVFPACCHDLKAKGTLFRITSTLCTRL